MDEYQMFGEIGALSGLCMAGLAISEAWHQKGSLLKCILMFISAVCLSVGFLGMSELLNGWFVAVIGVAIASVITIITIGWLKRRRTNKN